MPNRWKLSGLRHPLTRNSVRLNYPDTYTYDLDSNRHSDVHVGPGDGVSGTTTNTYNGDDELTKAVSTVNGETDYGYDANGSQVNASNGSALTTYTFDVRNKMVGFTNGTSSATYVYNDAGNRVRETISGTTTYYLTDTQNPSGFAEPVEQRTSATSAPTMTYLIGDHVFGQETASGSPTYFLTDGHGSTIALVNAAATTTHTVTAVLAYTAFGDALNFTPTTIGTIFQFGDGLYDLPSGVYFNGERGRIGAIFLEMNPPGNSTNSDPITLHVYLYANGNPVSNADPSGLASSVASRQAAAIGRAVHSYLAEDFRDKLGVLYGVSGPSILKLLQGLGAVNVVKGIGTLFPDLVDTNPADKEIFEIKPETVLQIAKGLFQLAGYLIVFNKIDPTKGWQLGKASTYTPPTVIETTKPVSLVVVNPPVAGLITYLTLNEYVEDKAEDVEEEEGADEDTTLGESIVDSVLGGI